MLTSVSIHIKPWSYKNIFWILMACLAIQKLFVITQFHFQYLDNDQLVYWNMAIDYSHGVVREPFFYGQDYNFPLEAWIAVPGLLLGIPPYIMLPLVSLFLSVWPFLIVVTQLYRKQQFASASLIILLLCTLPIQYDLMVGLPRGFIQGLFTASLAILFLKKLNPLKSIIVGFLISIAFFFNPNSLFLSVGIVFAAWHYQPFRKKMPLMLFLCLGLLIAYIINWQWNQFYVQHPNHNLHHKDPLQYHLNDLSRIGELDALWTGLSPLVWNFSTINLLIFIAFIAYFFKVKKQGLAVFTICLFFGILASVAVSKCADGCTSFLFPYSRFYLSIPILYALLLELNSAQPIWTPNLDPKLIYLMPLLALAYTIYKTNTLETYVDSQLKINSGIQCMRVDGLKKKCQFIQNKMREQQVRLLVNADRDDKVAYGCPCFWNNDSFSTLNPEYERRTWRLEKESITVHSRMMLNFWDDYRVTRIDSTCVPVNSYLFLVVNPKLTTTQWLKKKGYAVRPLRTQRPETFFNR